MLRDKLGAWDECIHTTYIKWGFPCGPVVMNLPVNADSWVLSLGWEDPLEEEMATYSSILAWKIPCTEAPGGLEFMGSQRATANARIYKRSIQKINNKDLFYSTGNSTQYLVITCNSVISFQENNLKRCVCTLLYA